MRIVTLFVRYGTEKYPGAERQLYETFARRLPGIEHRTVIVDNALPCSVDQMADGDILIGGDNAFWEFSGWDRAVAFLGSTIWSYDLVHLATSAFQTLYWKYLDRFEIRQLKMLCDRAACLGHIDCYNEPVTMFSFYSQHWLRSCFFFVRPTELKALGSLVSCRDRQRFFSGDTLNPFREDAPLSENYRRYILAWLTGGQIQGNIWHSNFDLTAETLPFFERKTLAIVNEHLLAARLRALNCRLIDVTWLATQLDRFPREPVPWETDWRQQLAGRDTDPLFLSGQPL
jgi:hypothetical protein